MLELVHRDLEIADQVIPNLSYLPEDLEQVRFLLKKLIARWADFTENLEEHAGHHGKCRNRSNLIQIVAVDKSDTVTPLIEGRNQPLIPSRSAKDDVVIHEHEMTAAACLITGVVHAPHCLPRTSGHFSDSNR